MDFRDLLNKLDTVQTEAPKDDFEPRQKPSSQELMQHVNTIQFTQPTASQSKYSIANSVKFQGKDVNDPKTKVELFKDAMQNTPGLLFSEISTRIKPTDDAQMEISQKFLDASREIDNNGKPAAEDIKLLMAVINKAVKEMSLERDADQSKYDDNADDTEESFAEARELGRVDKMVLAKLMKELDGYKSMVAGETDRDDKKMYKERLRDLESMIKNVTRGRPIDTALQDELSDMYDAVKDVKEALSIQDKMKAMDDLKARQKAIQDIQMDPNTYKDEELKKELMRKKAELADMKHNLQQMAKNENPMEPEDMERIKKNPPEEMGISKSELAGMAMDDQQEFEEYKDAVQDDIKDPTSVYAGKSTEEIVAMLRKEADGIGYADVSDGDRHPSEPTWLNKIADEMEKSKTEASGYEGQSEPYMHTIRVDGDYDMDRGITDKDCEEMEYDLAKGGIKAQCDANEMMQGGVNIHTMSPKSAVIDALSNAGYEVNEQADKDIQRIKDLAGL